MHDRMVSIKTSDDKLTIGASHTYDSKVTKDSEALHQLLCQNDPGDEYTVSFTNVKISSFCEHGFQDGNCANSKCPHTVHVRQFDNWCEVHNKFCK